MLKKIFFVFYKKFIEFFLRGSCWLGFTDGYIGCQRGVFWLFLKVWGYFFCGYSVVFIWVTDELWSFQVEEILFEFFIFGWEILYRLEFVLWFKMLYVKCFFFWQKCYIGFFMQFVQCQLCLRQDVRYLDVYRDVVWGRESVGVVGLN